MKVCIIEDVGSTLENMARILMEAGHEVQTVFVSRWVDPEEYDFSLATTDAEIAGNAVKEFDPDLVLVDHDLKITDGDVVIRVAGINLAKCAGTSSSFDQSSYCGLRMPLQKHRLDVDEDSEDEGFAEVKKKFVTWVATLGK